ncbi:hypothetical protein EW145_g5333 [Phellinidium pouzarii]|uniref:Uncharacterized protein n=1 Tax=Phellinidium pouzarii TaxID=167371 RepID=A0A4S4L0B5_9AGAM|nr:hypothetical protein EW145_g5333 [Phellinidium pouzarii]
MDDENHFFRTETDLVTEEARKRKAARTKHLGAPIDVPGKPLAIQIKGSELWVAQSDHVVRKLDLESGAISQVYRGHTGPVTVLALLDDPIDKNAPPLLISGSWDKAVNIWDTKDKSLISSTDAHSDFIKCVFPLPELKLLISSGSDKVVRFWDMTDPRSKKPLKNLGVISAHTRPVQCVAADVHSSSSATLYTADSMGVILIWTLERVYGEVPICRATQIGALDIHRTGVNDLWYGHGQLWSGSSDETAILTHHPPPSTPIPTNARKPVAPLTHPEAVKAILPLALTPVGEPLLLTASGDALRLYDVNDPTAPELLSTTDAHWLNVTALRLWFRRTADKGGRVGVESWIVSASLDGTVRRWRLADLISPPKEPPKQPAEETKLTSSTQLTAEEEAELAELMEDDD